ncbi:MAG TPA: SUF system NifU family Fe-S cluster assembly protein [Acidimicrobiales bacterium]|nr:SUF system NifU family Fe-S cluster assembly protein [Acidimicrobiales bacterium]
MTQLDNLYREVVLDHYRNPRGKGTLPTPPAEKAEGYNPYCGDEVTVYLEEQDGTVRLAWEGVGCSISQASASMMARGVAGKSAEDARRLLARFREMLDLHGEKLADTDTDAAAALDRAKQAELGDLMALEGVVKLPVRLKCALLPWTTLAEALDRNR